MKAAVVHTSRTATAGVTAPQPAPDRRTVIPAQLSNDPAIQTLMKKAAAETRQQQLAAIHTELETNPYLRIGDSSRIDPHTTVFTPEGHTLALNGTQVRDHATLLVTGDTPEIIETHVTQCTFRDDATVSLTPCRCRATVMGWVPVSIQLRDGSEMRGYEWQRNNKLSPLRNRLAPQLHQVTVSGAATVAGETLITGDGYTLVEGNATVDGAVIVADRTHVHDGKGGISPHPVLCDIRVGGDAVVRCNLAGHSIWITGDAVLPAEATVVSGAQIYGSGHIATVTLASGEVATVHPRLRGEMRDVRGGPDGRFVLPWRSQEFFDESPHTQKSVPMLQRTELTSFGKRLVPDAYPLSVAVNNASTATETEHALLDAIGKRMLGAF